MTTTDAAGAGLWLSASETAARLGLPVRAVIELAREGAIPCVLGPIGAPRFSIVEVEALRRRSALVVGPDRERCEP